MIDPTKDGIDHINVYSKGQTELGTLLSNFAHTPIKIKDGNFNSLEGYWYWLLSDKDSKAEILRKVSGWEAKNVGRELKIKDWPPCEFEVEFREKFLQAMNAKLDQHKHISEMLKDSTLPLVHYYNYGGKVVEPKNGKWILDFYTLVRKNLREHLI